MPTFKTVIHPRYKREDGIFRVKIRVTHNQQSRYIPTAYYANASEINPNFEFKRGTSYVTDTIPIIEKYRKVCNKYADKIDTMNVEQIVELLKNYVDEENFKLDFFAYGQSHIEKLKATGHENNATMYVCALNALKRYIGRDTIDIREITSKFVGRFIDYVKQEPPRPGHKKGHRAPSLYTSTLQALHNYAKKEYNDEDLGLIRIPLSPFTKVKKPRIPITDKEPMSLEQFRTCLTISDDTWIIREGGHNLRNFARDIGILSFFIIGINTVDLYNCTNIENGRLVYYRQKTKNRRANKAKISIRLEPEVMPFIEKYRDPTGVRLFNFYRLYKNADIFNAQVNKGLKRVGKLIGFPQLETYTFRRTWASIAWNYCGVRDDIIDFCLGHAPRRESKLAHIYITENYEVINLANRNVIDLVMGKKTDMVISNTMHLQQHTDNSTISPTNNTPSRLISATQ